MQVVFDYNLWIPPDAPEGFVKDVTEACTFDNPTFHKKKAMNFSTWDTPRHIDLTMERDGWTGIPRGMTQVIRDASAKHDVSLQWKDRRLSVPVGKLKFHKRPPPDYYGNKLPDRVVPWEYQQGIADAVVRFQNMLVKAPAASGKTLAGLLTISMLEQRAFVCVHASVLGDQWAELCERLLGFSPRRIGGGRKITPPDSSPVTIGMQQTLHRRLDKETPHFGLLILDEAQHAGAATIEHDVSRFPARYRVGLSEDVSRKDKKEFLIHAQFGSVRSEVPRARLVADKRVIPVDLVVVETGWEIVGKKGTVVDPKALEYNEILEHMIAATDRSARILADVLRECGAPNTGLLLSDRLALCHWFREAIWKGGLSAGLVIGGKKFSREFDRSVAAMIGGKQRVGIGTSAVFEGFDVPNLNRGFLITPGATNPQKMGQKIGRYARPHLTAGTPRVYYYLDSRVFPHHLTHLKRFIDRDRDRFASVTLVGEDGREFDLMR